MLKVLVVIKSIIILMTYQYNNLEYDLICHILKSKEIGKVNKQFYLSKDRFQTYGEISLAFSIDLLDPAKSFNIDSIFSSQQKEELEKKLKSEKPTMMDTTKISNSIEIKISEDFSNFQISYPIIQKGVNNTIYGIIFENYPSFESGGRSLSIYRFDNEKWTLIHESIVAIS